MTSGAAPVRWPAPTATQRLDATVTLPGSKSLTNRYLVLGGLAATASVLRAPLVSRDTELMAAAVTALGASVTSRRAAEDASPADLAWHIAPGPIRGGTTIDCGLAGTVMRFVPPMAALADGPVRLDGDAQARRRPLAPVLDGLRQLGVDVVSDGCLPVVVNGRGRVAGGAVTLDASASSQLISGLLLSGARYDDGVTVHHVGKPVPSLPHLDMTVAVLRSAGVVVDDAQPNTWRVEPGPIRGVDVTIEPDLSNAGPFLAAALVAGGRVRMPSWPASTTQPGAHLLEVLARMGAEIGLDETGLTVGGSGQLAGVDVDLHDASELTPLVAALAVLADSPTWIRGVAHIRGHETDRLRALATELSALGGDVTETEDGLAIRPTPLHGGCFRTYADHRLATAAAVIGLSVPGVQIEDVATTAKTMPDFTDRWLRLLGQVTA